MELSSPWAWIDGAGEEVGDGQGDENCSNDDIQNAYFGEKYYLQEEGGPIGLRSTCSIARLVMMWWDDQLVVALESRNIKMISGARYMDDVRVWLQAIRIG